MRAKTVVAFWASVAAATFLLGGIIASVQAVGRHPSAANAAVLTLSFIGLALALTVAGRIIVVVGRVQRQGRSRER